MAQRPTAYQGRDPYVFISYAHKDADIVYPLITQLQQAVCGSGTTKASRSAATGTG